jgi:hypothetical protein
MNGVAVRVAAPAQASKGLHRCVPDRREPSTDLRNRKAPQLAAEYRPISVL